MFQAKVATRSPASTPRPSSARERRSTRPARSPYESAVRAPSRTPTTSPSACIRRIRSRISCSVSGWSCCISPSSTLPWYPDRHAIYPGRDDRHLQAHPQRIRARAALRRRGDRGRGDLGARRLAAAQAFPPRPGRALRGARGNAHRARGRPAAGAAARRRARDPAWSRPPDVERGRGAGPGDLAHLTGRAHRPVVRGDRRAARLRPRGRRTACPARSPTGRT